MRKKALKKRFPNRRRIIQILREKYNENLTTFVNSEGREIILNLRKHYLYNRPYKNDEFQMEMNRKVKTLMEE